MDPITLYAIPKAILSKLGASAAAKSGSAAKVAIAKASASAKGSAAKASIRSKAGASAKIACEK